MTTSPSDTSNQAPTARFGYYPRECDLTGATFSIRTLPGLEATVAEVTMGSGISNDWMYACAQKRQDFMSGRVHFMPYSSRVFALPKTHSLTLHWRSPADLDFVVWCLSFFTGMRLTTTEGGFLDATPVKPGKLVDFVLFRCTLADAVQLALDYLDANPREENPRTTKLVAAVIHALFLSQWPQALPFEQFQYLYTALDACFRLVSAKKAPTCKIIHAKRIQWMCEQFEMDVPPWAKMTPEGRTVLSSARNDAFHEGLFFGEPLGFTLFGGNHSSGEDGRVMLQMRVLICRVLVAILGQPENDYVKSPVDTRQMHALVLGA